LLLLLLLVVGECLSLPWLLLLVLQGGLLSLRPAELQVRAGHDCCCLPLLLAAHAAALSLHTPQQLNPCPTVS
jgi:hypothetical protein